MHKVDALLFRRPLEEVQSRLSRFRRLEACWRLIEDEYVDEELSLEGVCRACGISEAHLNRLLNETIEIPFHSLLNRYRLRKACEMLDQKDYSLLEVALATGFGNPSSFRRYFSRLLGCTPREFRQSRVKKRAADQSPPLE